MFYKQRTPRILKIVVQLTMLMFSVSLAIASINLGLKIDNQQYIEFEFFTCRTAIDRLMYAVNNRYITRVLLNIANGYEPLATELIPDRWNLYS